MKQVIVTLKNDSGKVVRKNYYYSRASYMSDVVSAFYDLGPGQEIIVKVGNQYSERISFEDILEESKEESSSCFVALEDRLLNSYTLHHYISEYLPRY